MRTGCREMTNFVRLGDRNCNSSKGLLMLSGSRCKCNERVRSEQADRLRQAINGSKEDTLDRARVPNNGSTILPPNFVVDMCVTLSHRILMLDKKSSSKNLVDMRVTLTHWILMSDNDKFVTPTDFKRGEEGNFIGCTLRSESILRCSRSGKRSR